MLYERNNVRVWASELDPAAFLQAERMARVPIVAAPIGIMPDGHLGLGAVVGSVVVTKGGIMPSCVGVDLGCGVIAAKTSLDSSDLPENLSSILPELAIAVPAGVGKGHDPNNRPAKAIRFIDSWLSEHQPQTELDQSQKAVAWSQLGTLGSGNHFLEVCVDDSENVWVTVHSGSRGIGNQLARLHIEKAKEQTRAAGVTLEDPDLAWLQEGTPEFEHYKNDFLWAQDYALANRELMIQGALDVLFEFVGKGQEIERIQCHHNYIAEEVVDELGTTAWVTRKGAISAKTGQLGIVPGSMADGSYVTRGLGNPLSFNTSSHGAGRRLSRGVAKRTLSVETLRNRMSGVAWLESDAEALLDEHPEAYKDLGSVMADQADLTEPVTFLRAALNYKGL